MNYPAGSTKDTEEAKARQAAEYEAAQQAKRYEEAAEATRAAEWQAEATRAAEWQAEEDARLAAEEAAKNLNEETNNE